MVERGRVRAEGTVAELALGRTADVATAIDGGAGATASANAAISAVPMCVTRLCMAILAVRNVASAYARPPNVTILTFAVPRGASGVTLK